MKRKAKRVIIILVAYILLLIVAFFITYGIRAFVSDMKYRIVQSKEAVITSAELEAIVQKSEALFLEQEDFLIDNLKKGNYLNCSKEQQLEILAYIGRLEAENLGITVPNFKAAYLRNDLSGYYDPNEHQIVLNMQLFDHEKCCIRTTLHEMFHAYQYVCIKQVADSSNLLWAREIEAWRENAKEIKNNLDLKRGITDYYTSAMEKSAREYAKKREEMYFMLVDADDNDTD